MNDPQKTEVPELKAVHVPEPFRPLFLKAQEYVQKYFEDWEHNPEKSTLKISGERYLLVRGSSMSVDFFRMVENLYKDQGKEEARMVASNLLFDLSHTLGKSDAQNFSKRMGVEDPIEKLSAGPIHFAFSGWAFVDIHETSQPTPDENYFLSYDHPFSFEADAWIAKNVRPEHPVCVMNAGYSSGWCEESFGLKLVATEIECRAHTRGTHCRFIMAPPDRIQEHLSRLGIDTAQKSDQIGPLLIPEFFQRKRIEEELRRSHEDLQERVQDRTAELQKSKDRYEMLVNSIDGIVWEADLESLQLKFVSRKAEKILGYPLSAWLEDPDFWIEHVHVEDRETARKFRANRKAGNIEYRMRAKNGSEIWLHEIVNIVEDEGQPPRLQGIMIDATERKQALEALQHTQKLESLGILAGGIAHDFNNLLVGVLGNTSRLLSKLDKSWPNRDQLSDIAEAAKQASELTDQLLAYSGSGRFSLEPIDLNQLINDMANLSLKIISSAVPVQYELKESLPLIEGDPTQLRQVIMNLLTNASEAIDKKHQGEIYLRTGTVRISPEERSSYITSGEFQDGEQVFLEVQDNGSGILPEHLQKLFDPFFTTKFTGRGLGLAAVMGVVNSHHGAISVETGKEKGTTFRILMPRTKKERVIRKKDPEPVIQQKGRGLILVIDDDQIVRKVCRAILKDHGYEVITCSTGGSALNVFEKRSARIDAVILDLTMPETNGQELFKSLKKISPETPILLTSGYSVEQAEELFPPGSIAGFLKKPYDITTFMEKVTEALPKD